MKIKSFIVGPIEVNCYIVSDDAGIGVVIDPGGDGPVILDYVKKAGITVKAVLNTHGHGDHIGANDAIREATGAPLYIHQADAVMLTDPRANLSAFMGYSALSKPAEHFLEEGETLRFGDLSFQVLHTPGHSAGGVCFVGDGVCFSGDTLFAGSIGRTDFPGGSEQQLIGNIKEKLLPLPEDTVVYSGHGPATTIGREKTANPYLLMDSNFWR